MPWEVARVSHHHDHASRKSMTAPQIDRGYTSLLHHLHRPSVATLAQLDSFQTSIAYYLAYGREDQPDGQNPAPLAASTIGSSMFRFPDRMDVESVNGRLEMVLKAFRHAVHYKVHALGQGPANSSAPTSSPSSRGTLTSVFSLPLESKLSTWTWDILSGLQGGPSVVRFACLGGLLTGLEDLERQKASRKAGHMTDTDGGREIVTVRRRTRGKVEEEVIVALAEVMEAYPLPLIDQSTNEDGPESDWGSEFSRNTSGDTSQSKSNAIAQPSCV
jgi:hypothetical protein